MFKRIDTTFYKTALVLALPIAMQNLLTSCATLIDTAMVVSLGDASISAMGAAGRFSFLLNIFGFGFAYGATAIISQYWGANDERNLKKTYGFAITISMVFSILYALALLLFPTAIIRLFTNNDEIAKLGAEC